MISEAIKHLHPSAQFICHGDVYEGIVWLDESVPQPSEQALNDAWADIQLIEANNEYAKNRKAEYPPITDYLDGVVKGDQAQIDAYIAACQAVKAKYPKPESV